MNKETYQALKRVIVLYKKNVSYVKNSLAEGYVERIENWINEVAKEYTEQEGESIYNKITCPTCSQHKCTC